MDADTLRLILIFAGGLLLVVLYLWERRRSRPGADEQQEPDELLDFAKREPSLGPMRGDRGDGGAVTDAPAGADVRQPKKSGQPEQASDAGPPEQPELHLEPPQSDPEDLELDRPKSPIVLSFHVTPVEGTFDGPDIVNAASECGVEPGEMDIFHRQDASASQLGPLFSMANMVKPGTFPFGAMAEFESPGLSLFAQAEGASGDPERLEEMLATAHCLAARLNAEVRDETRSLLTAEMEERLRDRVLELVTWRLSDSERE
jgi:cell division protein ZipA